MAVICTQCGNPAAAPTLYDAGSGCLELFLWLCGILPGLVYHLWRRDSYRAVCPSCGSTAVVPMSSPVGRELQRKYGISEAAFLPVSTAGGSNDKVGWLIIGVLVAILLIYVVASR